MCALVGLLCIALPIPGFIAKFQMLYEYEVSYKDKLEISYVNLGV